MIKVYYEHKSGNTIERVFKDEDSIEKFDGWNIYKTEVIKESDEEITIEIDIINSSRVFITGFKSVDELIAQTCVGGDLYIDGKNLQDGRIGIKRVVLPLRSIKHFTELIETSMD